MIFYFTATGNSLYVSKELAKSLNDRPVSIPQAIHNKDAHYKDERIGIITPIFGHDLPYMVKNFLKSASFETDYFYFVLTYGNRHGNVIENAISAASEENIDVAYAATILMVDNWLPGYDMDEQRAMDKNIVGQLEIIAKDLSQKVHHIEAFSEEDRLVHENFLKHKIRFEPDYLKGFLSTKPNCIGCEICIHVCPSGCIYLENGKAIHDALRGLGCNACLACIHACPKRAIAIAMPEKNEAAARFRNENISIEEIIASNDQSDLIGI